MKSVLLTALAIIICSLTTNSQNTNIFFNQVDMFFSRNVDDGLVHYTAIKKNSEDLYTLIEKSNSISLKNLDTETNKAFWINMYNLVTIKSVIDNYPIKSPLDVAGFFDVISHKVGGEMLTLNDIENKKIRANYKDARIHFVLVCAGLGCPPLLNTAYFPETLDQQLENQTREALNNPNFIKLDEKRKKVVISEIFKWYLKDFSLKASGLIDYINGYREEKIPTDYKVIYYPYDWTLNKI
jgi:hypothetical protein